MNVLLYMIKLHVMWCKIVFLGQRRRQQMVGKKFMHTKNENKLGFSQTKVSC